MLLRSLTICAASVIALAFTTPVTALVPVDGLQDPAFGEAGRTFVDLTSLSAAGGLAYALALAPSGLIYVGGTSNDGRFVIARMSANGARDQGFGSFGLARDRPSGAPSGYFNLGDLTVLPDGRPLAAGSVSDTNTDVVLCRYNVAGNLDTSFDGDGCSRIALDLIAGGDETAEAMLPLPDGKFLLVGTVETAAFNGASAAGLLMRVNADGSLDTSFGTGGYRVLTVLNSSTYISSLARLGDGSLLVAGGYRPGGPGSQLNRYVAKYSAGGALLSAFGNNGVVTVGFDDFVAGGNANDFQADVLVDSQGRIYDCGASRSDGPLLINVSVARYTANGQLDPGFGTGGRIYRSFNDLNNVSYVYGCTLQRDRLVAAMHTGSVGGSFEMGLMRFLDDGSTDPSFGAGGSISYPIDIAGNGIGHEVAARVLPQGDNLLVYGSASPQDQCCTEPYGFVVIRALTDRMFRDGYE